MSNKPLTVGSETLIPQALVADQLGVTTRTLEIWRGRRIGPPWTNIGQRVYYRQESLERWIRGQEQTPPSRGEAA